MSLVLAFKADAGIVMAADSAETETDEYNQPTKTGGEAEKLFKVSKNCVVGIAGFGPVGIPYIDMLRNNLSEDELTSAFVVAHRLSGLIQKETHTDKMPQLSFVVAGFNEPSEPVVYRLDEKAGFFPAMCQKNLTPLGLSSISNYWMDSIRTKKRDLADVSAIAAFLILETERIHRDFVSSPIKVCHIHPGKVVFLGTKEIKKILSKVTSFQSKVDTFFNK